MPRSWLLAGAAVVALAAGAALYLLTQRGGNDGALATLQTADFHSLALSPDNSQVVLFGHHSGVQRSTDGGRTWTALVSQSNFDAMSLQADPQEARTLYLAGHDVFQKSTDGGVSWQAIPAALPGADILPGTDIHGFALNPDAPSHFTAFIMGGGLFASSDSGKTWQRITGKLPNDVMSLVSAGGSPETLYAVSMASGLLRSSDGGQTWTSASIGLGQTILSVAVDPVNRQTLYAGVDGGLYKSSDGGNGWSKLPFPGTEPVVVDTSPIQPGLVMAIAAKTDRGLVYRSADGGQHWNAHP